MSHRSAYLGLPLICLSLAVFPACGGDQGPDPSIGDADWPSAPIPQPGGNGEPGDEGSNPSGGDPGSGSGAGSEGGDTDGDWGGDGDPGSGSGDGDGDWGGDGDGDDSGDGDGDGDMEEGYACIEPAGEEPCDLEEGVCEAFPWTVDLGEKPAMSPVCCTDADCGCIEGLCDLPACLPDNWCDCNCNADEDPDCGPESCPMPSEASEEIADGHEDEAGSCPASTDPVVLYMSNDDSNSQASPAFVRRLINEGYVVLPHNVRVHEFLNYYDLSYANPESDALDVGVQMRRTNAQTGEFTLLLSAQGKHIRAEDRPPLNLVYSLDLSGSMSGEPIELLRQTVLATAGQLRAGDKITLLGWDTEQSIILNGYEVTGPNDAQLLQAINALDSGGGTNLHDGLVTAYDLANQHYIAGGINRVFLVSDGGANAGVTDIDLIAEQANDADGEGIYLIGVGVSDAYGYQDDLMDEVTDAGKGAYLFIDSAAEAERMFGESDRFLANTTVAARNVQMELTMPWYFGIKEFHGEEYSADPAKVEPQHLAANDAMSFHQTVQSCDPEAPKQGDIIKAKATYLDPDTLEEHSDEYSISLGKVTQADATQLYKGDVVVNYAKSFIAISAMIDAQQYDDAIGTAVAMSEWLTNAATDLEDAEVNEMASLMNTYAQRLQELYG